MSEQSIQQFLDSLPDKQPGIALDIGANHGLYTNTLAKKFEHCYAFECEPVNLEILAKRITQPNVTIVPKAIGKVNGKVKLYKCPPNMGAHSTCDAHPAFAQWGHSWDNWIWVPAITLDTFWHQLVTGTHQPIKFIKCDIEGAETFVFNFAERLFTENKLTMIIEIHQTVEVEKLYDLFTKKYGYKVFYLDDDQFGSSLQKTVANIKAGSEAVNFGYDIHFRVTNEN